MRYYTHFFDDAGFQIWSLIGLKLDEIHDRGVHPVVAEIKVRFLHELKAGSLIIVKGGFTKAGSKSIGHSQRMYNVDTGVLCATQDSVEVFFDPKTRTSALMPDDIRTRIADNLVDPDKD